MFTFLSHSTSVHAESSSVSRITQFQSQILDRLNANLKLNQNKTKKKKKVNVVLLKIIVTNWSLISDSVNRSWIESEKREMIDPRIRPDFVRCDFQTWQIRFENLLAKHPVRGKKTKIYLLLFLPYTFSVLLFLTTFWKYINYRLSYSWKRSNFHYYKSCIRWFYWWLYEVIRNIYWNTVHIFNNWKCPWKRSCAIGKVKPDLGHKLDHRPAPNVFLFPSFEGEI